MAGLCFKQKTPSIFKDKIMFYLEKYGIMTPEFIKENAYERNRMS